MPLSELAGLAASASHAELATALQARHSAAIGSGLHSPRQSPRKQRTQMAIVSGSKSSTTAVAQLPTPPAAATPAAASSSSAASAALAAPPAVSSALLAVQRSNPDSRSRQKGTYHHLPPLTEGEQKLLFDALPSLRSMDDVPAASLSLRATSLSIIRQWLSDKLSRSAWVSLIQRIRLMAEGGDHTHANTNDRAHVLTAMGLDSRSLHTAGIPPPLVQRLYKALWVYSEGMRELVTEVSHHSRSNRVVVGNLWKCYAILLEDHRGDEYVMAMMQIEQESQRVLREMEERFSKSLQLKQDSELRTQSEVKTLSTLLERSQIEARSLLEKKESLSHEILHLETANADLENLNATTKKELWFTSNALNRLVGKHDALIASSAQTEQKLRQEIHELKCEQEEIKMSLDQELATNERLSYKVDRFASNIADLTTSTARMRADLNEKVAEINLVSKVLEKTTKDCTTLEKSREDLERHYDAKIDALAQRIKQMELEKLQRETEELKRMEMEAEERNQAEERARAQEEAGDPIARSPIVLDLRAQLAALRAAHDKEVLDLSARNTLLSDRIRAQQKRIKELGGGRRFAFMNANKKEGEAASDSNSSSESSEGARTPLSPRRQLESVTEKLKQVSNKKKKPRRRTGDSDETNSDNSAANSRRSSRSKAAAGGAARISEPSPTRTGSGSGAHQYISLFPGNVKALAREVSALQSELESKEKLNTNLLVSVNKLKVNLSSREEDNRRHTEQIASQRLEISGLRDALSNESLAKATLQKRVADQAETIDSLRKTEKTCMDLRAQIQELQKNKILLLEAQSDLSGQLTEALQSSKALKTELKTGKIAQVKLRDEVKNLRSECDQRIKNQNELGLRIRTLTMETSSLQSLNDEIQRNLKSSNDASSLLGSLETKSAEINRLFLKIRDMEHTRIEQLKLHDAKITEVKRQAEADVSSKIEEAIQTEQARTKKLRAQISDAKSEAKQVLESVRAELSSRSKDLEASEEAREKAVKETEKLQKQIAALQADAEKRKQEMSKLIEQQQHAAAAAAAAAQQESSNATMATVAASPATKAMPSPASLSASQQATVLSPLQIPPVPAQSPQLSPLSPSFSGVSPPSPSSAASLPMPALLAAAGADELAVLTSGDASALSLSQSATLRGLAQRVLDSKSVRTALEESNFLMKNQISVLEDQLESMRMAHARLAVGGGGGGGAAQTPKGVGAFGGGDPDGFNMRRRKHKKSVSSGVTLLTDDNADYSSEDDAKRGGAGGGAGGVRFTRESPAVATPSTSARSIAAVGASGGGGNKRSSGGKSGPSGELLAGPPVLNRTGSFARGGGGGARKDGTADEVSASPTKDRPNTLASNRLAVNASLNKSPRSTLNRDKSPGSPAATNAAPPSLRRASSMDPSAGASRHQHISGSSSPNAGGGNNHSLSQTLGRTPSGVDTSSSSSGVGVAPGTLAPAIFIPPLPLAADVPTRVRSHSVHVTTPTGDTVESLMLGSPPRSPTQPQQQTVPPVAAETTSAPAPGAVQSPSLSATFAAAAVAAVGSPPAAQPAPSGSTVTSPAPRGSPIAAPVPMSPLSVPGPAVSSSTSSTPQTLFTFAPAGSAVSPSPPLPAASPPPAAMTLAASSSGSVLAPAPSSAAPSASAGALSARANADRQRAAAPSQSVLKSPREASAPKGSAASAGLAASSSAANLVPVAVATTATAALLASPPTSRPVTVALVPSSSSAALSRGRNGSLSTAASSQLGGLLSPAAAMAALQQLKQKVESNQKAVNFPKL